MKKRAFITGGSRGIGRGISLMLAENGYEVLVNYRSDDESALSLQSEITAMGGSIKLFKFDIADFDNAQKTIQKELDDNGPIEVLVFNAGTRKDALFPIMDRSSWDNIIDVNLKSFYYICNPISKSMFSSKYGKIVIISSLSGITGVPSQVNYSASKAGIIGAAKSLSIELARRNINVNVITPGYIYTDLTKDVLDKSQDEIIKTIPMRRIGKPEDIANLVEFLISDKSSYITGQVISCDGGVIV